MISKASIDKIFDTAIIEEVIGDYVRLKKRGSGYVGLSPWTSEKTPSFHVSPSKNIYKDFSSGKGGNVVNFLMEMEGFSYPEALRHLAKRYNIEIDEDRDESKDYEAEKNLKEALFIANNFALDFYKKQLFETEEGKTVGLSYLKERGFNDATIQKFDLAYAPNTRNLLGETMLKNQFKEEVLLKAGLIKKREYGTIDFFRERVLFTIHNYVGKVVGFGGRSLKTDKKIPKYLNTPESDIYNKSKLLYGLFQAKMAVRKEDNCFLVEGYTDVIALSQAGIENVVASAGTALTTDQIKLIKRLSNHITMLYDGDAAGLKAAMRGLDLCLQEDMHVNMVLLPPEHDPDSFVKENGGQGFRDYVEKQSEDFLHFKAKHLKKEAGNNPSKKADMLRDMVQSLALINDGLKRSIYVKDISLIFDVEEELLINSINKIKRSELRKKLSREEARTEKEVDPLENEGALKKAQEEFAGQEDYHNIQERDVIRLLVEHGRKEIEEVSVIEYVLTTVEEHGLEFKTPHYLKILNLFKEAFEEEELLDPRELINHKDDSIRETIIDLIHKPYELSENWEKRHEIYHTDEKLILERDVHSSLHRFAQRTIEEMMEEIDREITEHKGSEDELMELLKFKNNLLQNWHKIAEQLGSVITKR